MRGPHAGGRSPCRSRQCLSQRASLQTICFTYRSLAAAPFHYDPQLGSLFAKHDFCAPTSSALPSSLWASGRWWATKSVSPSCSRGSRTHFRQSLLHPRLGGLVDGALKEAKHAADAGLVCGTCSRPRAAVGALVLGTGSVSTYVSLWSIFAPGAFGFAAPLFLLAQLRWNDGHRPT